MKIKRISTKIILLAIIFFTTSCIKTTFKEINPQWGNKDKLVKIFYISKGVSDSKHWIAEFSNDSQYFARLDIAPWKKSEGCTLNVWNLNGDLIINAIDSSKLFMTPEYRCKFNLTALRQVPYSYHLRPESDFYFSPYPTITKDTLAWYVSQDWKYMVTFNNPLYKQWRLDLEKDRRVFKPSFESRTMAMWQLDSTPVKIWEKEYKAFVEPMEGFIYSKNNSFFIYVADYDAANIYSCSDGSLLDSFHFSDIAEHYHVAISPEKELIACQKLGFAIFSVFSTQSTHELVFSCKNKLFLDGDWAGGGIQFAGSGKYLIVKYGRGASRGKFFSGPSPQSVTEIYDTDTWELVWQYNTKTKNLNNICISNDGKKVAIEIDNVFEIGTMESFLLGYKKLIEKKR